MSYKIIRVLNGVVSVASSDRSFFNVPIEELDFEPKVGDEVQCFRNGENVIVFKNGASPRKQKLTPSPIPKNEPPSNSQVSAVTTTVPKVEPPQIKRNVPVVDPLAGGIVEKKSKVPWIVGIILLLVGVSFVVYYMNNNGQGKNGENDSVIVKGTMTDSRDGKTYKTVKIGGKIWMAENLAYKTENSNCILGQFNGNKFGCLYTWGDAIDSVRQYDVLGYKCGYGKVCPTILRQGICPEGWILPSDKDWVNLYAAMGESFHSMQAKGIGEWKHATDKYGFTVIPVEHNGSTAHFWSSTDYDVSRAYGWGMHEDKRSYGAGNGPANKKSYSSVRCIKE